MLEQHLYTTNLYSEICAYSNYSWKVNAFVCDGRNGRNKNIIIE